MYKHIYFAGEHTSPFFLGFMEGALRSGAKAAFDLITDFNKNQTT